MKFNDFTDHSARHTYHTRNVHVDAEGLLHAEVRVRVPKRPR
jgi:hypothetical protein